MKNKAEIPKLNTERAESKQKSAFFEQTRMGLEEIFQQYPNLEERSAEIQTRVDSILQELDETMLPAIVAEKIREEIQECQAAQNKEEFVAKGLEALKPILEVKIRNPEGFEEVQARAKLRANEFMEINDLFLFNFKRIPSQGERLAEIKTRFEVLVKHLGKDVLSTDEIEEARKELDKCATAPNNEDFIKKLTIALGPIFRAKNRNLAKFEDGQARAINEISHFTEINRLLSFGKSGSTIHIHAPIGTMVENKITLYREGMKKLAEIIVADPAIKEVTGTSRLVTNHESLFKRAGFEITDGPGGQAKTAVISRDKFLERFLEKD